MPTTTPQYLPLPDPEVPMIDVKTGKMTPEWYRYFKTKDRIDRQLRKEIP